MRNKRIVLFTLCTTICALPSCTGFGNSSSGSVNEYAPVFSADGKTVKYGYYPQTHVNDSLLIKDLNEIETSESNGLYILDGTYYAKKTFVMDPSSSLVFDDGTKIVTGNTCWFRCEPIKWDILESKNEGVYSLISSVLLDAHRYDDFSNNYKDSEIREWLNGTFYDTAFSLNDSFVQTVTVDNSASTTDSSGNGYVCEDTQDKVYLLSYQDYKNTDYFPEDAKDCKTKTTDWARANGAYYGTDSPYLYNGWYWSRSPNSDYSHMVWGVSGGDGLYYGAVDISCFCARPAITIKVS